MISVSISDNDFANLFDLLAKNMTNFSVLDL